MNTKYKQHKLIIKGKSAIKCIFILDIIEVCTTLSNDRRHQINILTKQNVVHKLIYKDGDKDDFIVDYNRLYKIISTDLNKSVEINAYNNNNELKFISIYDTI